MEKIYLEVDKTTIFRGEQIRCVKCEPYSDCSNCCFYFNGNCNQFECYAESRKDGANVIFHNEGIAPTELIKLVSTAYSKYRSCCDMLAEIAQMFIDWDDNIGCEYFPSDGVYLTTSDAKACPADSFFEAVKDKDRISQNDFEKLCI